jgi:hypothetical protein
MCIVYRADHGYQIDVVRPIAYRGVNHAGTRRYEKLPSLLAQSRSNKHGQQFPYGTLFVGYCVWLPWLPVQRAIYSMIIHPSARWPITHEHSHPEVTPGPIRAYPSLTFIGICSVDHFGIFAAKKKRLTVSPSSSCRAHLQGSASLRRRENAPLNYARHTGLGNSEARSGPFPVTNSETGLSYAKHR